MSPIKVLLDTSPLGNAHAHRGIGMYTKLLTAELQKLPEVQVLTSRSEATEKPDIVHYPYFDLFFSTLPFFHPGKAVVTIHDVIPLKFPKYYRPGLKGSFRFQKQRLALGQVAAIITDSEASKADIVKELGLAEEKVNVVYLAANPELRVAKPELLQKIQKQYDLPEKYVLYVGDINYNKNLPQLIKALKFLPDEIHLVLAGKNFVPQEIPEWQWLETQIAMSDVEKRVHLINEFEGDGNETLSALYTGAAVYVQPSLAEGFGLPVLEAMVCETPVICSQNSSLIEVGGEHAVMAAEPTAEVFAKKIEEVLGWSASLRAENVKAAARWARTFSWTKAARETVAVYQKVLT